MLNLYKILLLLMVLHFGLRLSGSLPIYSGGALKSGEREASAALEAAITKSLLDRISISQSVISSWSNLQVSAAVISARKREVEASELAYLGTIEEARLGSRTILDVLNARMALKNKNRCSEINFCQNLNFHQKQFFLNTTFFILAPNFKFFRFC